MANWLTRGLSKGYAGPVGMMFTDKGRSKIKGFLQGEDPNKVALPDDVQAAQQQRSDLISKLMGGAPRDEAQKAVAAEGRLASERASATAQSQAAGVRGFGALLARQAAQMANANAQAQISANQAVAAQQAAAQDVGAMQRDQALAAGLLGQQEQSALMADEWRRQRAKKGFAGVLGGLAGGVLAPMVGAPPEVGAQLGYGVGQGFMY